MARDLIPPPAPSWRALQPDGTPNLVELPPEKPAEPPPPASLDAKTVAAWVQTYLDAEDWRVLAINPHGVLLASPGGLVVLEEEHPTGWMRADCFGCHNVNNIHQINRTGLPDDEVDLAGVRAIVQSGGESSCMMCHGSNGVPP